MNEIVAFSPDGKRIASGGGGDEPIVIWDASSGHDVRTLSGSVGSVRSLAFSPSRQQIASGNDDNTIRIWDTETGAILYTLRGHSGTVESVAFSADGTRIVSGSADKTIRIRDADSGKEILTRTGHTVRLSVRRSALTAGRLPAVARIRRSGCGTLRPVGNCGH